MLKLEDLQVWQLSMKLGGEVWNLVAEWKYFEKDTVGKQFVRAADSIAANISEGYGRYSFKENRQFCLIARGSLMETKTFMIKAKERNLVTEERFNLLIEEMELLHKKLNGYIRSIGENKSASQTVSEFPEEYSSNP